MIAIPVDSAAPGVKSSELFGNVKLFAIYQPDQEEFYFVQNPGCGDGVKTAEALQGWDIESVVYSHMGEGVFKALDNIDVYFLGKEPKPLFEIVEGLKSDAFVKLDTANAGSYLDPGTHSGSCKCG